jgi:hypothetical protein
MTQAEIDQFEATGRSFLTGLAQGGEQLGKFAASFEQRGGAPVYGDNCLRIVELSNDFQEWLTPERQAIIADLRVDV